jgi:hypothetical protein
VAIERTFSPPSNGRKIPLSKIKLFWFMPTLFSTFRILFRNIFIILNLVLFSTKQNVD